jgi:hypothetical protein
MISGTTHIGATLRDMFDISPAKLPRPLLRRNWVDDYAETAPLLGRVQHQIIKIAKNIISCGEKDELISAAGV